MCSQPTFLDDVLTGKVEPGAIDGFIDRWHDAPNGRELHDYLGMTREEYSLWFRVPDALSYLIKARREAMPLNDAVAGGCRELRTSTAPLESTKIARLEEWLKAHGELP